MGVSKANLTRAVEEYTKIFLAPSDRDELDGICVKAFLPINEGDKILIYPKGYNVNKEEPVDLDQDTIKQCIWNRGALHTLKNRVVPYLVDGTLYYSIPREGMTHLDCGWFFNHAEKGGEYNVDWDKKLEAYVATKDIPAGGELILKFDQETHDGMEKSAAFIDKLRNDTEGLQKAKAMDTSKLSLSKDTIDIIDSLNNMMVIAKPSSVNGIGIFVGEDGDLVIKEQLSKSDKKVNPFPIANGSNYGKELSRTIDIPLEELPKDPQILVYLERYLMEYEIEEGVYVLPIPIVGTNFDTSYYINTTHNNTLGESNLEYDRSRKGGMSSMSITKELNVDDELFLAYPLPNGEKKVKTNKKTNKKIAKQQRKKKKKAKVAASSTTDGKTEGMDTSIETDVDLDSVMSDSSNGNGKSDELNAYMAALGGKFEDKPPQPPRKSKEEKFKLPTATKKALVPYEHLPERWRCLVMKGRYPKQPVLVLYYNPDSADHKEPLFHAGRLKKSGYTSNYEDKNSLEYVAGQPRFTVDELVKKGDKGVEHRYSFLVIAYDENNKKHEEMKNKGEQIEKYGGEYGALIINQKLLEQALTEAVAIGRKLKKSNSTDDYYIVTPSKNDDKILAKYEKFVDLVSAEVGVGQTWDAGEYTRTKKNGQLSNSHITQEGMIWKQVYLRKFDRNDGSLEKWLGKIGNNATRYEDIETDNERLNELLEVEIAQYYLYIINDEKVNEKTVQLPKNLSVESLGTFDNASKLCDKMGVTSNTKKQDIREKLKKKNLGMDGPPNGPKTWAKGKEVAEEAWCVLEVEDSTYLVRGNTQ